MRNKRKKVSKILFPDFLEDYDKSKQRRSLDAAAAAAAASPPPVPRPRQLVSAVSDVSASTVGHVTEACADSPKSSLRTRSSSLTIHDKRSTAAEDISTVTILRAKADNEFKEFEHKIMNKELVAVAQWIHLRLPSCRPGFKSKAYYLCFYQFKFEL